MVVLNKMEQNRLDREKMMLSNIEKNINSIFFINIFKYNHITRPEVLMDQKQLTYFIAVAKYRNFSRAAQDFYLTQ